MSGRRGSPEKWWQRGPKPGQRLLAVVIWYWLIGMGFCLMLVFGLIYIGGAKIGLWKGPPEPTPESIAADIASDRGTRESKGFHTLKKYPPDPSQRVIAEALLTRIKEGSGWRFRLEAVKMLSDWGRPEDAGELESIVKNTHWGNNELRHAAIATLGKLGGDKARELLMEAAKHEADRKVATAALEAMDRKK